MVTPVARLQPVFVGGVTVSNASLHNRDEMERLGVGLGDTGVVRRAGDVIPQVVSVLNRSKSVDRKLVGFPDICPSCGNLLDDDDAEVAVRCVGSFTCPAQLKASVLHFASRRAMDIEGLGQKLVDQLVDSGLVKNVYDLYCLDEVELASLDRMAKISAKKLVDAIEESKKHALPRFLYALGILDVGEVTARNLSAHFGSMRKIMSANEEELLEVDDVGPIVASRVMSFFSKDSVVEMLQKVLLLGIPVEIETQLIDEEDLPLQGQTWVVTGRLTSFTRDEVKIKLEALGAKLSNSVSKKTARVLAGEEAGSKLLKAKSLSLPILDEKEFHTLISSYERAHDN